MAKEPKNQGYTQPNERQVEGLKQLIQMITRMQNTMQQEAPEEYAKMIEQPGRKR